jgi:hypothetical protein
MQEAESLVAEMPIIDSVRIYVTLPPSAGRLLTVLKGRGHG